MHKALGSDGMHPQVVGELVVVTAKATWLSLKSTSGWERCLRSGLSPILRKGEKVDTENYRPVSLILVPGNVVEQTASRQGQDVGVVSMDSQRGTPAWLAGRTCWTCWVDFVNTRTWTGELHNAYAYTSRVTFTLKKFTKRRGLHEKYLLVGLLSFRTFFDGFCITGFFLGSHSRWRLEASNCKWDNETPIRQSQDS